MPFKIFTDFSLTKQTRIVAKKTAYTHQKITKKSGTILFCLVGQKYKKLLVGVLGEMMASSIHSEFN